MRVIDKDFLTDILNKLLSLGEHDGYVKREAFTREALMAESFIISKMQDIGLDVKRDGVGNILARRPGSNNKLPMVAAGSHIDTCAAGAMHESAIGMAVILAAMESLQYEECLHPLEVIVFAASEYNRFGMSHIGSRFMADENTAKYLMEAEKHGYDNFFKTLCALGHDMLINGSVLVPGDKYKSFIEVYTARRDESCIGKLGLVTTVGARTRLRVIVSGEAAYGISLPAGKRHDAIVAAARLITGFDELVRRNGKKGLGACIGGLTAEPEEIGAVVRSVRFYVDVAGYDDKTVMDVMVSMSEFADMVMKKCSVAVHMDTVDVQKPVDMAKDVTELLHSKLRGHKGEGYNVYSTESRDGGFMTKVTSVGMLEVPFVMQGTKENVNTDDLVMAAEVLAESMLEMSGLLWKRDGSGAMGSIDSVK